MPDFGVTFSLEEMSAPAVIEAAALAEQAGFRLGSVSDHFHPWNDQQGESPFVWSVLGGLSVVTDEMTWQTAVTCPTVRIHPAIIAQAAATTATLLPGRFRLGVGSGEALNESILGDRWPPAEIRLEMLEEAIDLIRKLWEGDVTDHRGRHYRVENARIYSLPDQLPPIIMSGFGEKSIALAAAIADGYITTKPDADALASYREQGGSGVLQGSMKCCYGPNRRASLELAHRLWPNSGLPGELPQILPTPAHFEQAATLVPADALAGKIPCGPDPQVHIDALQKFVDAGFDEIFIAQIGPNQADFLRFYEREVLPSFGSRTVRPNAAPTAGH
jgi:G6PDH family F420-dependent oxidoreductase